MNRAMTVQAAVGSIAFAIAMGGCGGAQQPSTTPPAGSVPIAAPDASSAVVPAAAASSPAPATQAQSKLAADSLPEGLSPLSDDEVKEAETQCKPLGDALADAAKRDKPKVGMVDFATEFLKNPPKLAGVDAARCGDLILKDLNIFRARTMETEAIRYLQAMARGVRSAYLHEPPTVCPSASPTPANLSDVKDKSYKSTSEDWSSSKGWSCIRFALAEPQRYQYELRMDPAAKHFEGIARGLALLPRKQTACED